MKRSAQIRLVLLGGLSAGAFTACGPSDVRSPLPRADAVYGNDYRLPVVGYYHAPYRAWYPLPYNHFDPARRQYFHGGLWSDRPHESIINLSEPRADALQAALVILRQQQMQQQIRRGGFGYTSHGFSSGS